MKFPKRHKKIFIYPNRYGFLFFLLFALSIAVGATYNNNLVFLMGFVLISFLFVSILITAKNLRDLEITHVQVTSGFPGEQVPVEVTVKNNSKVTHTRVFFSLEDRSTQGELVSSDPQDVQKIKFTTQLPDQRGVYHLKRVKMSTQNPFGLFYSWLWYFTDSTYYVYPSPLGNKERPRHTSQAGEEFSGLKTFQAGDRLSRVSWKQYAKRNELMVKEFNDSENNLDLISLSEAPQTDFEDQLRQLSLWLVDAESQKRNYALMLKTQPTAMSSGSEHLKKCLQDLAKAEHP